MVDVYFEDDFRKAVGKTKDAAFKEQVKKQIAKIVENPEVGKPMRFGRQGTREVYISPYRLMYLYFKSENMIVFLDIYHKDSQ